MVAMKVIYQFQVPFLRSKIDQILWQPKAYKMDHACFEICWPITINAAMTFFIVLSKGRQSFYTSNRNLSLNYLLGKAEA